MGLLKGERQKNADTSIDQLHYTHPPPRLDGVSAIGLDVKP